MIKNNILQIVVITMAALLCVACGTSSGGSPSAPATVTSPSYEDPSQNLFRFVTADGTNTTEYGSSYRGTVVFYKIYTDLSTLYSQVDAINAANATSLESGYTKMQAYSFQQMNGGVLIPAASADRNIAIRLFDETIYTAGISIDGSASGTPVRSGVSTGTSFTFTSSYYPNVGGASDNDFTGTASSAGPWYVAAFAAAAIQKPEGLSYAYSVRYIGILRITQS